MLCLLRRGYLITFSARRALNCVALKPKTFAENIIGVLAEQRRVVADAGRRLRHVNPRRQEFGRAGDWMIRVSMNALRSLICSIFDDFAHRQHRRAEVVDVAQPLPEFLAGFGARPGFDQVVQLPRDFVCAPARCEARVVRADLRVP